MGGLDAGIVAISKTEPRCALDERGVVKCWGLLDCTFTGEMNVVPTVVEGLDAGATAVAHASDFGCAALTTGGVQCWGALPFGCVTSPVYVLPPDSGVIQLVAGAGHACALASGKVRCWGWNNHGQLGDGTSVTTRTAVDVVGLALGVSAIATGGGHTCAVTADGHLQCWGWNGAGQLGDGTVADRSAPVNVQGLEAIIAVSAGAAHTCAASAGSHHL